MKPAWLRFLPPAHRTRVQRWLTEPGAGDTLGLVAKFWFSSENRSRGRPSKQQIYRRLAMRAAIIWMTGPDDWDYGQAAQIIAEQGGPRTEQMIAGTPKAIRDRILKIFKAASPDFWEEAERAAIAEGRIIRRAPGDKDVHPDRRPNLQHKRQLEAQLARFRLQGPLKLRRRWPISRGSSTFENMPVSEALRYFGDAANAWAKDRAEKAIGGAENAN